ncbi:MAG: hypothetical protein AAGE86_03340 [Pseudomonadota bacterium]
MEAELTIIFAACIIMLIILGLSVNAIVSKVLDFKRTQASIGKEPGTAETKALSERTAMVEDRLAVLERIATDRGQLLSDEIDQLRVTNGTAAADKEKLS